MGKAGRPTKYDALLQHLDDFTIYTPALIARLAREAGMLKGETGHEKSISFRRLRVALGRRANIRNYPDAGDGMVTIPGQAPCPGWFGWRWKGKIQKAVPCSHLP